MRHPNRYWTPERIDSKFDELTDRDGRIPTYKIVQRDGSGLINAIIGGRYDPDVRRYSEYLIARGLREKKHIWDREQFDAAFDDLSSVLGRTPKFAELCRVTGGAGFLTSGAYDASITSYTDYLRRRGISPNIDLGKWTRESIDHAFESRSLELGRVPTSHEFSRKSRGALAAIKAGRYHPNVLDWVDFLVHRNIASSRSELTPENIGRAFDELCIKLGRFPTPSEFRGIFKNALPIIEAGNCGEGVNSYGTYLRSRSVQHPSLAKERYKTKWTPESINSQFDALCSQLGRLPTHTELVALNGGLRAAIGTGHYRPDVRNYSSYIAARAAETDSSIGNSSLFHDYLSSQTKWTPPLIDKTVDDYIKELGRPPTSEELQTSAPGAHNAIVRGVYNPTIKRYSAYLERRGLIVNHTNLWDPYKVDEAFDNQVRQLGRTPTVLEFKGKNRGALNFIRKGRYNAALRSYSGYLRHREIFVRKEHGFWKLETIDAAFEKKRDEIGRTPTITEFESGNRGATAVIRSGKYSPDVHSWGDFLKKRGLSPKYVSGKWKPEVVDAAFDAQMKSLGRVPKATEFGKKHRGALAVIVRGRYRTDINSFQTYIQFRGFATKRRGTLDLLSEALEAFGSQEI